MRFQHQTVKHLLNLVARQYVMSQKQFLSSSKLKTCMSVLHVLPCKLGIVISRCIVYVARCLGSKPARTEGKRNPSLCRGNYYPYGGWNHCVQDNQSLRYTGVQSSRKSQVGTYLLFQSLGVLLLGIKVSQLLGVFLLPTGLESSRSQGYPPALSLLVPIYKYTNVERDIVGVKCLAQGHNTMSSTRV